MADNAKEAMIEPFMDEDEMIFWGPVSEKERQIHARLPRKTTVSSPNSRYGPLWQPNLPDENQQAHGVIAKALGENEFLYSSAASKEAENPNQEEVIISSNVIPPEMVNIVTGLECLDLCENVPADSHLSLNQLAPDFVLPKAETSQANPIQDRQSNVSSLMKFSISSIEGPIRQGEIEQAEIHHSQSHNSSVEHEEAPSTASEEDNNEWNSPIERDLDDNDASNESGSVDMNDTIERMERLLAMAAQMERENSEKQASEAGAAGIKEEEHISLVEEKEIPEVKVVDIAKPKPIPAKPPRGQKPSETPKYTPIARKSAIVKTPSTQLSQRVAPKFPKRNAAPPFATPKPPTKPALNTNRNRQMHCANPHLLVTPSPKAPKCTATKTKSNVESKFAAKTQSLVPLAVGTGTAHDRSDSSISSTASGSSSLGIKLDLPVRKPTYQSQKAKAHLQSVQSPIGRYIRDENQPTLIKQIRPKLKKVASNPTPFQEGVKNSNGDWTIVTESKIQAPAEDNKENRELLNKNAPSLPIVLVESAQGSIVKPMIDPKAPGVYGKMEKLIKGKQNPMVIQHFARVKLEHQGYVTTAKSSVSHSSSPAKEIRAALLNKGKADVCVYSPNKNRPATSDNSERNLEVSVLQAFSAKKTLQKR